MLGLEKFDEAGILRIDNLDDLEGVILSGGHAAGPVHAGLRADAQLLDNSVIWNLDRHTVSQIPLRSPMRGCPKTKMQAGSNQQANLARVSPGLTGLDRDWILDSLSGWVVIGPAAYWTHMEI